MHSSLSAFALGLRYQMIVLPSLSVSQACSSTPLSCTINSDQPVPRCVLIRGRIDDIEDDSTLRRGKPTAYLVFGKAQTVNSATYLYARATRELEQLKHPESKTAFLGTSAAFSPFPLSPRACFSSLSQTVLMVNRRIGDARARAGPGPVLEIPQDLPNDKRVPHHGRQ